MSEKTTSSKELATDTLVCRVKPSQKTAFTKAAEHAGMGLSTWIRVACTAALRKGGDA